VSVGSQRSARATTRDTGIALRDLMEKQDIVISSDTNDGEPVQEFRKTVEFIDVSDPDNPVIHLSTGQTFRCVIVAVGP
jgi:hypothetical protein